MEKHTTTGDTMTDPRYDAAGQRMTDCCAGFATYGPNVTLANLDTVPLKCAECGRLTTPGEGDGTEYRPGVTAATWYANLTGS
jgi:hypothetical protein